MHRISLRERVLRHWRLDEETQRLCADMHKYIFFIHNHRCVYLYGTDRLVDKMIRAMMLFGIQPTGIICEDASNNNLLFAGVPACSLSDVALDKLKDGIILCSDFEHSFDFCAKLSAAHLGGQMS